MEARGRGRASPLATNGQILSSGSQSPVVPPGNASGGSSPTTPQQSLANPGLAMDPAEPPAPGLLPETQPPTAIPAPAAPQKRGIIARLFGTSPAPENGPPSPGEGAVLKTYRNLMGMGEELARGTQYQLFQTRC